MVSAEAWIELGRVLEAHSTRAFLRAGLTGAAAAKELAAKERAWGGGFEDCGAFYREGLARAEGGLSGAVEAKISQEKRYKSLKLAFLERFPAMRDELEARLDAQIRALGRRDPEGSASVSAP